MSTMRHGVRVGRCRTSILCATWIERTDALSNVPRTEAIRTGRARQINAGPGLSYRIPALRQQAAPLPPSSPDCCKPAIPATGRPILPKTVERGTFREDLFYRLNVFAILIAPLRERADEILRPSAVFLQEIAHAVGPPPAGLTTHAREALLRHDRPDNVRELRNALERAAIVYKGSLIDAEDLALNNRPRTSLQPSPITISLWSNARRHPGPSRNWLEQVKGREAALSRTQLSANAGGSASRGRQWSRADRAHRAMKIGARSVP